MLEVGAGTGVNLPYYRDDRVTQLLLTEPDPHMRRHLEARLAKSPRPSARVLAAPAEQLPLRDGSIDTIVATLLLCTVPSAAAALDEWRRVLRAGGTLLFLEHVAARDEPWRLRLQRWSDPLWSRVADGCHLTRDTESEMRAAGWKFLSIDRSPIARLPPVVRPSIRGVAVPIA